MQFLKLGGVLSPLMAFAAMAAGAAQASDGYRVSGPHVHDNLAVYFVHGKSAPGKVPLTLEEAMARNLVQVRETSNVNELEIENVSDQDVFVQSGDIVKGGKQDRTLMVSLLLPPRSGRVPIASFCVEQGRWSQRAGEDAKRFSTASATLPSREMKLAMKAPLPARAAEPVVTGAMESRIARSLHRAAPSETGTRQQAIWDTVRSTQAKLARKLKADVRAPASASSLQLALEHDKVREAQQAYVKALKAAGEADDDIVGYVFAVNGKLNSADIYPSNGLFRKMWSKLLTASAIEAIGHKDEAKGETPSVAAVQAFLADGESAAATEKPLNKGVRLATRDGDKVMLFETARAEGFVHRNYLAK